MPSSDAATRLRYSAGRLQPAVVTESAVPGEIPRYELSEWRERWGVVAGITARGFDLGLWTDAPVGEVMGRWRLLRGLEPGLPATVLAHQVHGPRVHWHDGAVGWTVLDGADGHATAAAGVLLTVTVADCVPVFLFAPRRRAAALLHAGWRGTAADILARGVALLQERAGATPDDLVLHAGVGICGDCYEVGREVVEGVGLTADGPGPWRVDLRDRLLAQAAALGIEQRHMSVSAWCSAHDRERFYSHRASGGRDGRMVAYLGIPSPVP